MKDLIYFITFKIHIYSHMIYKIQLKIGNITFPNSSNLVSGALIIALWVGGVSQCTMCMITILRFLN